MSVNIRGNTKQNLKINNDGELLVKDSGVGTVNTNDLVNNLQVNFIDNISLSANTIHSNTLDLNAFNPQPTTNPRDNVGKNLNEYNALFLYGECNKTSADDTIAIFVSHNNNDYYKLITIKPRVHNISSNPTSITNAYHFTNRSGLPLRYMRIGNTSGNTITNLRVHFTLLKI